MQTKIVELSYSDKFFAVVSSGKAEDDTIRIFNTKDALAWGVRSYPEGGKKEFPAPVFEVKAPRDHTINSLKWGYLDKYLIYATDRGRIIRYDIEAKKIDDAKDVHKSEIFSIEQTIDFSMLLTCSRDGTCKLLNP
mmetsp:Transcript_9315/g.15707  ORF Transcript_9315/g.15707 Transcript_9315/m.15707 type:complete len:136 (+) Transcript_9315:301-708(+)